MLNDHPNLLDQQRHTSWPLALTAFILCVILVGATQVYAEGDAAVLSSTDEMQAGNEFNDRSALPGAALYDTFLTGAYLFHKLGAFGVAMPAIWMGALAGTLMFLNVWLIIWPKQQIVLGMKEGDGPAAAAKAGLASRTNTLLSGPMLLGMLGSGKLALGGTDTGLYAAMGLIVILEANALFGGQGPMKSVVGVVHCSLALALVIFGLLNYV